MLKVAFFDVGETIVDETREYGTWADWLGIPRHTFSAVFGAVISQGRDYREAFQYFRPGFDLDMERELRAANGKAETFFEENLYPDVRPCLSELREQGLMIGLAGNQTARAENILRTLALPVDMIGTSDGWGVEKPNAAFFERVVAEAQCAVGEVLYVGDRREIDIRPAQTIGMPTALIRRGPWAYIEQDPDLEARCLFTIDALSELPELVRKYNESVG